MQEQATCLFYIGLKTGKMTAESKTQSPKLKRLASRFARLLFELAEPFRRNLDKLLNN